MLKKLSEAWKKYLQSIPVEDDPVPLSDAAIMREMKPPHSANVKEAWKELAGLLTSHLTSNGDVVAFKSLLRGLRSGEEPIESLGHWISNRNGPKQKNIGVLSVDWKARDEVCWQILRIASAHGKQLNWRYDEESDQKWRDWVERGFTPVMAPLSEAKEQLSKLNLSLQVFEVDDGACAFAVPDDNEKEVRELCDALKIKLVL